MLNLENSNAAGASNSNSRLLTLLDPDTVVVQVTKGSC